MRFEGILGQEVAKRSIGQAFDEGRLAQSLLFYGPDGVGKELTAMAVACVLNCTGGGEKPCLNCPACRRTLRYQHPDFTYRFPVPHPSSEGDKKKLADEVAELLREKAEKPQLRLTFDRPVAISIDDVRELQALLSLKPFEGGRKVVVIAEPEAMTTEAANAFLKILEEPSPTTVFILVSARPAALLPTILSRCQKVRFEPLPRDAVIQSLTERFNRDRREAGLLADLSGGSLGRALDLIDEDLMAERETAWQLLGRWLEGSHYPALELVDEAVREKGRPARILDLMAQAVADALRHGGGGRIINSDKAQAIGALGAAAAERQLLALARNIERAQADLGRNVSPSLCLLSACITTEDDRTR